MYVIMDQFVTFCNCLLNKIKQIIDVRSNLIVK